MTTPLEDLLKLEPEEIWTKNERPTADQMRVKQQIYYEDIEEGTELPKYIYKLLFFLKTYYSSSLKFLIYHFKILKIFLN